MSQPPAQQPQAAQSKQDGDVLVPSDSVIRRASVQNPGFLEISDNAAHAAAVERDQTFWQAVKMYPKAIGWSVLLSTAIVMEGYDTLLLSNLYGLPQFQKRYGVLQPDGRYVVTQKKRGVEPPGHSLITRPFSFRSVIYIYHAVSSSSQSTGRILP